MSISSKDGTFPGRMARAKRNSKGKRKPQFQVGFLLLALAGIFVGHQMLKTAERVASVPYSQFLSLLDQKQVLEVSITDDYVRGKLKDSLKTGQKEFVAVRVDNDLAKTLQSQGIRFSREVENTFVRELLMWIVPIFIFGLLWIFIMRRFSSGGGMGGNFLAVGKSKARIYAETGIPIRFPDVAGVEEAKEELKELVDFLRHPSSYGRLGGRMPKGILLVGPPGTGKTLLAKAVAGEAKVPFFSISGSEFVEMFVGVGAARVRDLFEQARNKAPCIVFIDELDALGRARAAGGYPGGHDEKEQTLNQLLVEMDGFDSTTGLVLLAATNRPEILDPALLRAGRFDRQVLVDRPDKPGRIAILKVHLKKIKYAENLDLEAVASLTSGFTGADLANLVNEAALIATRRNAPNVSLEHFTEGMERIVAGLEKKSRILSPKEKEIVAYHEMGHALAGATAPGSGSVHKVSIIPRGVGALGYTIQRPTEDRFLMTREELEQKLRVLFGGRAAEHLIFGHFSTGAADDLSRATDIARSMATRYGMVESLGNATYDREPQNMLGIPSFPGARDYSEKTAGEIDVAVTKILDAAFTQVRAFLSDNVALLREAAQALLARETLTEEELKPIFARLNISKA
jgi:cell division protease FtsH